MSDTTPGGIGEILDAMTLEEKVRLLTGRDLWTTWPIARVGLRAIVMSDGPSGVRGEVWDERDPSLNLPSATALAASWDTDVARRYGAALAVEARRKDIDVVLGPTINLHRSPLGGRHFEAFSEDPLLTSVLAAAYVRGLQDNGVGATVKHYVVNDSETERFTLDAQVGDRALRELYLLAFEEAIVEARAWLVMSAYNGVNGTTMSENELLQTPLKSEWRFDGVVVSDWTAVRSLESARHAQDLAMPGPNGPWGDVLVEAVRAGEIAEGTVDDKVRRILLLAERVGAIQGTESAPVEHVEDGVQFARKVACEGMVLLENRSELPWSREFLTSIAVIGDNALNARTQGGGSASVVPEKVISPLAGLKAALPDAEIAYALGAIVRHTVAEIPLAEMENPVTGEPGVHVRFLDHSGAELHAENRRSTSLVWVGGDAPISEAAKFQLETRWTPASTGRIRVGFAAVGLGRVFVDGEQVVARALEPIGTDDILASRLPRDTATAVIDIEAGKSLGLRFEFDMRSRSGPTHLLVVRFGTEPAATDPEVLIAEAVAAAERADAALVVVGTNPQVESEGFDRTSLALPGHQDQLVSAVAAVNPRTVVLVNAGSPVLMPWRDEVAAVIVGWFGGQEFGAAVAAVLLGDIEPGGRLPTTWPAREEDVPVLSTAPIDGMLDYSEGVHIGYRAWLRSSAAPAYWFGAGRGYAEFVIHGATATPLIHPGDEIEVVVDIENVSSRSGKHVIQIYAECAQSAVERPVRWLVGFAALRLSGGERRSAVVKVLSRRLAYWDAGWQYEEGPYLLRIGGNPAELGHGCRVSLQR